MVAVSYPLHRSWSKSDKHFVVVNKNMLPTENVHYSFSLIILRFYLNLKCHDFTLILFTDGRMDGRTTNGQTHICEWKIWTWYETGLIKIQLNKNTLILFSWQSGWISFLALFFSHKKYIIDIWHSQTFVMFTTKKSKNANKKCQMPIPSSVLVFWVFVFCLSDHRMADATSVLSLLLSQNRRIKVALPIRKGASKIPIKQDLVNFI